MKLLVPTASELKVVDDELPVTDPGLMVQLPEGRPLNITLPVATEQVGCVIVPTVGASGVAGCAPIAPAAADEIHPSEFFAVIEYAASLATTNAAVYAE